NVANAGRDAVGGDGAFDEQHVRRTAKSCGSDAPTLASSFAAKAKRQWQESPVTGESAKETVKTIARGMPGDAGVTVVTMLVCFLFFACEAAGASRARHSLRPHLCWAGNSCITRAWSRRENAEVWVAVRGRHCEEHLATKLSTL